MKKSVRFTSEKSANDFAEKVNGTVKDLRSEENSKSDFKVTFDKGSKEDTSYNDWFDECSNDGSFAYNGITDDF